MKPKIRNAGIQVGHQEMDAAALRSAAQAEPKDFARKVADLVENGHGGEAPLRWENVRNVKALQESLADVVVPVYDATSKRAIESSAFPVLTGTLTVAGVNAAYQAVPEITSQLVTEMDDNKKITTLVGILSLAEAANVERVPEGKPFPLLGAAEEKFQLHHRRRGARIVVTQELIDENDIAGIVGRVNALGEWAAEQIEKQSLRRVCDIDGSGTTPAEPYVLRRNGTGVSLYQTSNATQDRLGASGNRLTNNALVDSTDIENARLRFSAMKNSRGERISVLNSEAVLLVPDALLVNAWKILNSTLEPGVWNEKNFNGPEGGFRPRLLSSPKLDDLSTSAWYLMASPTKQFCRKWKLRPETVVLPGTSPGAAQSFLDARIGFQARLAFDMEVGSQDQGVYTTQSLSGTTAP